MAVESRGDLASRHGSIVRIAIAHSWSYRSDNPMCTRTLSATFTAACLGQMHRARVDEEVASRMRLGQCAGAPNQPAYRSVGAADNRGGRRYSASALGDRSNRVRGIQELERQAVGT